jgi:hypothetical protein
MLILVGPQLLPVSLREGLSAAVGLRWRGDMERSTSPTDAGTVLSYALGATVTLSFSFTSTLLHFTII